MDLSLVTRPTSTEYRLDQCGEPDRVGVHRRPIVEIELPWHPSDVTPELSRFMVERTCSPVRLAARVDAGHRKTGVVRIEEKVRVGNLQALTPDWRDLTGAQARQHEFGSGCSSRISLSSPLGGAGRSSECPLVIGTYSYEGSPTRWRSWNSDARRDRVSA